MYNIKGEAPPFDGLFRLIPLGDFPNDEAAMRALALGNFPRYRIAVAATGAVFDQDSFKEHVDTQRAARGMELIR